jgi:glycosyltransferase involved in cell wall biosynthesis
MLTACEPRPNGRHGKLLTLPPDLGYVHKANRLVAMDRPTAFLLVANYPSDVGYAWWLMESFWCALAQEYHERETVLLAYPFMRTLPDPIARAPLQTVELDFTRAGIPALLRQLSFLSSHRVKAIYFTDQRSFSWRYLAFRLVGVRSIIVHDHTPGRRTRPTGWRRVVKQVLHRLAPLRASGLIGATSFVTRRHREISQFPAGRTFTAANGLPAPSATPPADLTAELGIPADRVVIVSVGRASPVKNIATAIEAMRILVHDRSVTGIHFLHLGDGPQLEELRELVRARNLEGWVSLPGRVSGVRSYLLACDIAIHPSRAEVGYSLSILEFMQAALPLVVSDDPSVCEATVDGETGLLFHAEDPQSAADALERLIKDSSLRDLLGQNSSRIQREQFSLENTHRALLAAVKAMRN